LEGALLCVQVDEVVFGVGTSWLVQQARAAACGSQTGGASEAIVGQKHTSWWFNASAVPTFTHAHDIWGCHFTKKQKKQKRQKTNVYLCSFICIHIYIYIYISIYI
jgi:hypothetical protein